MKLKLRVLCILLLLCILIVPTIAFANAPAPDPYDHKVLIDDISEIESISVYGCDEDGERELIEDYDRQQLESSQRTRIKNERILDAYNKEGKYTHLQLVIVFDDGDIVESEIVELPHYEETYTYYVQTGHLIDTYGYDSSFPGGFTFFGWVLMLLIPLGITILFEWLTALAFRIKRSQYVVFTNLVSNPVMNIIILFVMTTTMMRYISLLVILELSVIILELLIYSFKYKEVNRVKLLLFTVAANAVSFAAYALFNYIFTWI